MKFRDVIFFPTWARCTSSRNSRVTGKVNKRSETPGESTQRDMGGVLAAAGGRAPDAAAVRKHAAADRRAALADRIGRRGGEANRSTWETPPAAASAAAS